ncbi:MAG: PQQ-binding-like beta-propeller repeat protein [Bacteroidota bacterium]
MKNLCIATLLLWLCLSGSVNAQFSTGWNNGGGNPGRNGYSNVSGPTSDSIYWQSNATGIFGTPAFIEGNRLVTMRFFSLTYAPVVCYDLTTGSLLWSVDVTNNNGRSLPMGLRNEQVYVVRYTESSNDTLYALDVNTGSLVWTANVTVAPYITTTATFDSDGDLFIEGNQKIYKINHQNGQMAWQLNTIPMASGSGEMSIYMPTNTGYTFEQIGGVPYVWATDLSTGTKKYSHVVSSSGGGGPIPQCPLMVGPNGVIYVQLQNDNISAFLDNGTALSLLWSTPISGDAPFSHMCVGSDGSVYAPSNGKILRLDPQMGIVLDSSITISASSVFSPRLSAAANGMVYATNSSNTLYAFNNDLQLMWTDPLPGNNTSGVSLAPNGLMAVTGTNIIRVYTSATTGQAEPIANIQLQIYPNPTNSSVYLSGSTELIGKTFKLFDGLGRMVYEGAIAFGETALSMDHLDSGVYILHVESTDIKAKIIKQAY